MGHYMAMLLLKWRIHTIRELHNSSSFVLINILSMSDVCYESFWKKISLHLLIKNNDEI